jgi:DNA replication and repair protein RecF
LLLKSLRLSQFRNWSALNLDVEPGLTLIVGPNGAGKTNLLEAVTLASCGASLRGAETDHMIQWGQRSGQIRALFEGQGGPADIQVKLKPARAREIRVDSALVRLRDLVGRVPLVTFVPDDLTLIKGEPEARRRSLNMVLCQVDRLYMESVKSYQEALRQRNAALRLMAREGRIDDPSLDAWEESLIRHGLIVMKARAELISELGPEVQTFYEGLSNERGVVEIHYRPSVECPEGEATGAFWRRKLSALRRQELALGVTSLGPHRDDLELALDGHATRSFSSQGEQRTVALAFKFAQVSYLEKETNESPLFLLDDVLSELDESRRARLVEFVTQGGQCLVTLTNLEAWSGPEPKIIHLPHRATDLSRVREVVG